MGSSTSGVEAVPEHQEEEEAEEEETDQEVTEEQQRARTMLSEYARFRPGKYLGEQARATCEALLAEHLAAGWDTARLGRYLRDWSAQAHNPSTWLPHQLRELGAPPALNHTHSENQQHQTEQQAQPAASDEARAAARAAFPLKQPTAPPQPRWKQRLQAERSDFREPERAFGDLEELLGQNPEPPQTN